ncbi:MAG: PilT/PilU family type 4a pilus ATPase [Gammaproteobacteria bacterium]|nr:PilT/PilU family type 4a pilus ATPase [Gammaproteobacteria bacterium]
MDRNDAIKYIHNLLRSLHKEKGSDLYISAGAPPAMRVKGKILKITSPALTPSHTQVLTRSIMSDKQAAEFEATNECNFSIALQNLSRFRISAFVQRGSTAMVIRQISDDIPSIETLHLPSVVRDIVMAKRGLVIVVGGTGTGKSTSLASMIDFRNQNTQGHIITIEDPIEFIHQHKGCLVSQREIGTDTESFEIALKNSLRQAPDVILIGEIRDSETMEHGIKFAETGHLCLATLHANNSNQAVDRIINFFPEERHEQVLSDLSLNLRALISQRLVPTQDAKGMRPAVEVLINTPLMQDLIAKGSVTEMKELMSRSTEAGMQTFDQALFKLVQTGDISLEEGLKHADSENDLRLQIKLHGNQAANNLLPDSLNLTLEENEKTNGLFKKLR